MTIVRNWHTTDEPGVEPGKRRRTIGNWINYRDTAGVWRKTDLKVRRAEAGDEFLGRPLDWVSSGAPIQFFVGDPAAAGGRPWWGARRSEDAQSGIVMFLESGDAAAGYTVDAAKRSITYEDVLPDTDLVLYADDWKIDKWLALHTATSGEGGTGDRAVLGFVLPDGWSLDVIDSGTAGNRLVIKRGNGEVVYRTRPAVALDSSAEPQQVPCTFIRPTPATATLGGLTYWRVRVRCTPSGFVRPILMDPSVTISGTTDIEDTSLSQGVSEGDWNYGSVAAFYGGSYLGNARRALLRIAAAAIPAGTITGLTWHVWSKRLVGSSSCTSSVYFVSADKNWVEGTTGGGGGIQVGSSCFNWRVYNTAAWSGGAGGPGYTADPTPPAFTTSSGTLTEKTVALIPSWATSWRDVAPGGILVMEAGAYSGNLVANNSTEAASDRPYFEIDYDEPVSALSYLVLEPSLRPAHSPIMDPRGP